MVRKRNKIPDKPKDYEWPFEISFKLDRSRPKIAFLSGCARDYFPNDPGFSRFALAYCLPDPADTKECDYVPADQRLNKPISKLGYGIGGLSSHPRFPKNATSTNPPPNAYQSQVCPPRIRDIAKRQKVSWRKFVKEYEELEVKEIALEAELAEKRKRGTRLLPVKTVLKSEEVKPIKVEIKKPRCIPRIAFGRSVNGDRFYTTQMPGYPPPATGTYNPGIHTAQKSFQVTNPQGVLIPRVRINCIPAGNATCMGCGTQLYASDYYQTKQEFRIKNAGDIADIAKYKWTPLSMCRACYCRATKDGHGTWIKEKIPQLFMKTRHCNSMHDHQQGQPEYLTRASCKEMLRLTRKELHFSRYFKDNPCQEVI